MTQPRSSVVLFSGGLDSTALVYALLEDGLDLHLFGVNYGQSHVAELEYAATTAARLALRYTVVKAPHMSGVGKANVYPHRNSVLIALAAARGVNDQGDLFSSCAVGS